MNVLIVGGGGREHAIAWKLADSTAITRLMCLPGNPGTAQVADNIPGDASDLAAVEKIVKQTKADLVVIGPEDPLAAGLADRLLKLGVKVFGPSQAAAQIEADKWFAKELMRQQSVPTADARSFTDAKAAAEHLFTRAEKPSVMGLMRPPAGLLTGGKAPADAAAAAEYESFRKASCPCVVKAVGLAKGKGVTVCYRLGDALDAVDRALRQNAFGSAGARVVVEDLMVGAEVSVLALVDRRNIYVLEPCQDHKAVDDGDTGPMTGGMGAYTPTPVLSEQVLRQIERDVLVPTVDGMVRDGIDYKGVLYAGLMLTNQGPKVLEFNCRFGDPEAQPLLTRLKTDLLSVLLAVADGTLDQIQLEWDPRPAVCVVATSKGYPGKYKVGLPITGVEKADAMPDVKVYHAGTKMDGEQLVTDGGRVLGVTAIGDTVADARRKAYAAMDVIKFDGMHYRRDIGHQAMR